MAGMNCLMRGTIGDLAATDDGAALILELFAETQAVAAASGYPKVRPAYREQIGKMLTEKGSLNNASMHHDLAHGSRTEGEYIIGDMRRRAAALRHRDAACCAPLTRICKSTGTVGPRRATIVSVTASSFAWT